MGLRGLTSLRERLEDAAVAVAENAQLDVLLAQRVSELEAVVSDLAHNRLEQRGTPATRE